MELELIQHGIRIDTATSHTGRDMHCYLVTHPDTKDRGYVLATSSHAARLVGKALRLRAGCRFTEVRGPLADPHVRVLGWERTG